MEIILEAKKFAEQAHSGQKRKISGLRYFTHVENVALTLKKAGFPNKVVAAGYLHDVIEDTDVTKEQLLSIFGEDVVNLILDNTENKQLGWEDRKSATIIKAKTASIETKALIAADKLDNSQDIIKFSQQYGNEIWDFFNRGYDKQSWYYQQLEAAIRYGIPDENIPSYFFELKRNVEELFGHRLE